MPANMQLATKSSRTLTRSVSASNMPQLPVHKSGSDVLTLQKDFSLNKTKALEKKSISCSKEHMKCSMKQGDNLVIEFSAAAYELARTCIDKILSDELFPYGYEKKRQS